MTECNFFINGHRLKINKWQTGALTPKVIEQLKAEPKVLLPLTSILPVSPIETDSNVPDSSKVGNHIGCTRFRVLYADKTQNLTRNQKDKPTNEGHAIQNGNQADRSIESELSKMFDLHDTEEERKIESVINKPHNKNRKARKARRLKEKLIRLFGSSLEDVPFGYKKPQKIKKPARRHTLPVSINITNEEILNPLRVSQKRKSETDANLEVACKTKKKIELVTATISTLSEPEFMVAPVLVKEEIVGLRAGVVVDSLVTAVVMDKPRTGMAETRVNNILVIDLTDEDAGNYDKPVNISLEAMKEELSSSSERAKVPEDGTAMSSQCYATPREATLPPETSGCTANPSQSGRVSQRPPPPYPKQHSSDPPISSQRPPPTGQKQHSDAPIRSNPPAKRVCQDPVIQQTTAQVSKSSLSNQRNLQADKTTQQAPVMEQSLVTRSSGQLTMQFQPPLNLLEATVSAIMESARSSGPQVGQYPVRTTQYQRQNLTNNQPQPVVTGQLPTYQRQASTHQTTNQQAPELIRMFPLTPSHFAFHLISNAACGERLLPHVRLASRWKFLYSRYRDEVQKFLPPKFCKDENSASGAYANQTLAAFGRSMIQSLHGVDVDGFNITEVCLHIHRKLEEEGCQSKPVRVLIDINSIVSSCADVCVTPFTKKFFGQVKSCILRVEERSQKALFTVPQLKQLETQIRQFVQIKMWTDAYMAKSNSRANQQRPPQRSSKALQRKQTSLLRQAAMIRALPMSKRTDNPNQSNLNPADNTQTRQEQVPTRVQITPPVQAPPRVEVPERPPVQTPPRVQVPGPPPVQAPPRVQVPEPPPVQVPPRVQVPEPPPVQVPPQVEATVRQQTSVIVFSPEEAHPVVDSTTLSDKTDANVNSTTKTSEEEEVIDLTWIEDGDEIELLKEVHEMKEFHFKIEGGYDSESSTREAISPADSGLGSPRSHDGAEAFKCLCGKTAIYVCACNNSMYCGKECQVKDWVDHQKWCQGNTS